MHEFKTEICYGAVRLDFLSPENQDCELIVAVIRRLRQAMWEPKSHEACSNSSNRLLLNVQPRRGHQGKIFNPY